MKEMHNRLMSGSSMQHTHTGSQASQQMIVVSQGNVQISRSSKRQHQKLNGLNVNLVSSPSVGSIIEKDTAAGATFKAINLEQCYSTIAGSSRSNIQTLAAPSLCNSRGHGGWLKQPYVDFRST